MIIDFDENIKKNEKRLLNFFYSSVEDDIETWKYDNGYYSDKRLQSKTYNECYFVINLDEHTLNIKDTKSNTAYILAKYNGLKNIKVRKYVKYILKYKKEISTLNFYQKCIEAFESIFIKEVRKEKLEKIMRNT